MMKIGIDASRLVVGRRTGTENYSWQIIRGLIADSNQHDFNLYFNQTPSTSILENLEKLTKATSTKVTIRAMPFARLWTHLRLSREMLQNPPDVLFVPAHVLPLLHPRRSVVTIHDLGYLYYPEAHTPNSRRYLDYSTRFSASQAAKIIAVSQATRRDLIQHYRIDSAKIEVVYHGFDRAHFQPIRDIDKLNEMRQRYNIAHSPYLLFVGTLQPRKNLIRLFDAFAMLLGDPNFRDRYDKTEDLQLIIAGKQGWLNEPLIQHAAKLGLGNKINFVGYVADEDLPTLLSGAAAFVLPSLYEGFGLPVLEAMACGTPVICSNAGSLPEIAGQAALLHNPLDSAALAWQLRRLLTTPTLQNQLREAGFERVASFSWEQCVSQTRTVLESV